MSSENSTAKPKPKGAVRLEDKYIQNLKPDASKRLEYADTLLTGLYLILTPTGAKSWAVRYRFNGTPRKLTLGKYPVITLSIARELAKEALLKVAAGGDPAAEKTDKMEAEKAAQAAAELAERSRFENIAESFYERYLKPKNRSADESKRVIARNLLPVWGNRQITQIGRRDVIELLDDIVDSGRPIMANRVLALVRKLFNWCIERGIIETNPASNIQAPGKEVSRDRVLDDSELTQVMVAADQLGWPFGPIIKLLVLTAQRRDEVSGMRWADVDLDRKVWTIPASVAKNGKAHEVPLSPAAIAVIEALPHNSDIVFSTTGRTAVSGFSKAKERIDALILKARHSAAEEDPDATSTMPEWRLHDLRRTAASGMARLGVPPHVADKCLNHVAGTIKGVAAVYNRHAYANECRQALEVWADSVERLLNPIPADNIVELRKLS